MRMTGFIKNKLFIKIASYIIIGVIFLFLFNSLWINWQKIQEYNFSFNYVYLIFSVLILAVSTVFMALIWRKIIVQLDNSKPIASLRAIKIFVYSMFGKYLPGQIWMPLSRVYLATKEGLSKEILALSILYETIISITAGFLFAFLTLGPSLSEFYPSFNFYFVVFVVFAGILSIIILPRVFRMVLKITAKKFKVDINVAKTSLGSKNVLVIFFYYFVAYALTGFSFFFFINSFYHLSMSSILTIVGGSVLAVVLGTVAFFAPAGLGVRDGILIVFLGFYFPIGIATLISIASRIWVTLTELTLFFLVFILFKLRGLIKSNN